MGGGGGFVVVLCKRLEISIIQGTAYSTAMAKTMFVKYYNTKYVYTID
jgi:ribosomal protein S17